MATSLTACLLPFLSASFRGNISAPLSLYSPTPWGCSAGPDHITFSLAYMPFILKTLFSVLILLIFY